MELIGKVHERALDPTTRIDEAKLGSPRLPAPAAPYVVEAAEKVLGHPLHPVHKQLLSEVANGGFGPGYGMVGLPGGHVEEGLSALELAKDMDLPEGVLPLCDLGFGAWACIECATGAILVKDGFGLTDSGRTIDDWFEEWATGVNVGDAMFGTAAREITNPFTHDSMTIRVRDKAIGQPYTRDKTG
jgi:hypothetical protein